MDYWHFNKWCEKAVSGIKFPPDKWKVAFELRDHMLDHCESLMEQGYDEPTARDLTIKAMGDVDEIARQLAAIHRPFWGYFLRATRVALVLLLIITIIPFVRFVMSDPYSQPTVHRYDPYTDTYVSDEVGVTTRVMYAEPKQQAKSDGYTFELTRAAWHHTQFADEERELDSFRFQIKITNPLPWANEPDIRDQLWAQDSEGMIYPSWRLETDSCLIGDIYQTAPFTWTMDMWVSGFSSQDAQWLDICYAREGRDLRFRIDLTGGDAP